MEENQLREVVVTRSDDRSYGLTVSGESPVMVQDVKDGGPASQAGVLVGDCIIKVNGVLVSQSNHKDVVQIIKSSSSVRLTVSSAGAEAATAAAIASAGSPTAEGSGVGGGLSASSSVLLRHHNKDKQHNKITAPLPVNNQLQTQLDVNRHKMLSKMLDTQLKIKESIHFELQKAPSKSLAKSLEKERETSNRQIATIQAQLTAMKEIDASQGGGSNTSEGASNKSSRPTSQHCRAKSSPEAITAQSHQGGRRLSSSDSMVDLGSITSNTSNRSSFNSSKTASTALIEDEPPPGTPPPPYANNATVVGANDESHDGVDASSCGVGVVISTSGGGDCGADDAAGGNNRISGVSLEEEDDNYCTIPEEVTGSVSWSQNAIQSMEDDDFSDQDTILEDHGPFQSLSQLWSNPAYLAVFMNYIISNCSPATLFFYMITDLYKEGAAKEMKKWAYEIHSSFLLPGAPLPVGCTLEDTVLHEIDETLRNELDKEEILRKVFLKARQRGREVLNDQLADFRSKRTAGLGNIFGPPDHVLQDSKINKNREMGIIESVLVPFLESVSDEWKGDDQSLVMASSLATILWKWFNVRSPKAMSLIDRCPLFVNKDRPLRNKLFKASKKQLVRDHHFNQLTFYSVTYCNHCQEIIWGVAPQGYQCANCEMNIHKSCAKLVEELCIGQVRKKPPRDKKLPSFLGKIIPDDKENKRKSSQNANIPMDKRRGGNDDDILADYHGHLPDSADGYTGGDKNISSSTPNTAGALGSSNSSSAGILPLTTPKDSNPGARRSDSSASHHHHHGHHHHHHHGGQHHHGQANHFSNSHHATDDGCHDASNAGDGDDAAAAAAADSADVAVALPDATKTTALRFLHTAWASQADAISSGRQNVQKKKSGSINRSESYKDKHQRKRIREDRRKHSDPNIPTSKTGDVDVDSSHNNFGSGSSSTSSLSQSLDSPSLSLEQVSAREAPHLLNNDSDVEVESDLPDWSSNVPPEQLAAMTSKERKRQDTINELFHTEQTHVRMLKVMFTLFYIPLQASTLLNEEHLAQIFPNLDNLLNFHSTFNEAMKKRRREQPVVGTIGDILTAMFEGPKGEQFELQAAMFVRSQSQGLEGLKLSKKRDQKLASFLQEQENHVLCRRLQLKDMLPAGFQRLSKYPLLLESLLGYTDMERYREEYEQISRCLDRSREILASVDGAVREEENHMRLIEIQKRLDQDQMRKNKNAYSEETKGNLFLPNHRLVHEGPLTWRFCKGQKNIDVHVLILEDIIVLLQKDNDKFILKCVSSNNKTSGKEDKVSHTPVIYFCESILIREVATENRALFIITTQSTGSSLIYELVANSETDLKTWFRNLKVTQAEFDAREGVVRTPNRRSQPPSGGGAGSGGGGGGGGAAVAAVQHDHNPDDDEGQHPSDDVDEGMGTEDPNTPISCITAQQPRPKSSNAASSSTLNNNNNSTVDGTSADTLAKKTAENNEETSSSSGGSTPALPAAGASVAAAGGGRIGSPTSMGRCMVKGAQIIQIVEDTPLISPSEVTVSQGLVLSAEPVRTPIENLRRKDISIKESLEEKQHIIADILGIPREHFETLADMAGEPATSAAAAAQKEPKELVLAAIYQANCLQQTLNEALTIRESDIVAAKAGVNAATSSAAAVAAAAADGGGAIHKITNAGTMPLYPAPMNKLMNIAGSLSQQLNSLLKLVSEREEERERMRRELVSSREHLHQLHSNSQTPNSSRPNSLLAHSSDAARTEEDGRSGTGRSVEDELSALVLRDNSSTAAAKDSKTEGGAAAATENSSKSSGADTAAEASDSQNKPGASASSSTSEPSDHSQQPPAT